VTLFANDLLKGKVVLITGGATGLGKAMAKVFITLGADIALMSRNEQNLKTASEELSTAERQVFYTVCDVRDSTAVAAAIDSVIQHFGRIDVLINNAAGNFISPTERLSPRAVDTVLNIVLHGTFYTTLELGKRWIEQDHGGVMLNIVTTYASTGSSFVVPSAAAKAGVLALTRSLAVEWAKYGIRQVAIAPGPFPTEGASERLAPSQNFLAKMADRVPLGRFGDHEELANLAAYLISDYAAYINGEVVTIDGGEWLQGAGEFNDLLSLSDEEWDELTEKAKGNRS